MSIKDYIGLISAVILTALGIFFGNSFTYAYSLIIISIGIVIWFIISTIRKKIPKIFLTRNAVETFVEKLYDEAATYGGRLFVTHVRPCTTAPAKDFALRLRQVKSHVEYERFLFLEDRAREVQWVRNTLGELDENVDTSVYTVRSLPFLPSPLWRILPRANLMLYSRGNRYVSLLGLDRLVTSDSKLSNINFAVTFLSKEVFHVLHSYIHSMTANKKWLGCDKYIEEYKREQAVDIALAPIQSAVATLVAYCENDQSNNILNCGLFGRRALEYAGIMPLGRTDYQEADVDFVLIVEPGTRETIKKSIIKLIEQIEGISIVWGDDDSYFYFYREHNTSTLDIEILDRGTDFYIKHPLLGHSIFAFYLTLFRKESGAVVRDLIPLPKPYLNHNERMRVLLKDRKGLEDFRFRLNEECMDVDPRRVVSQVLRNLAWASTGVRHYEAIIAVETLRGDSNMVSILPYVERAFEIMQLSSIDCRKHQGESLGRARELVNAAISLVSTNILK